MKKRISMFVELLWLLGFALLCTSKDFDFFYFVQQWPGSYCNSKHSCCFANTGKPASDFSIHGLWPNYKNGSYPSNCDPGSPFNPVKISNLTRRMQREWPSLACPGGNNLAFWAHEWNKHGTCSMSILDENKYFSTALNLKAQINLLQILRNAGIEPNGELYSLISIKDAIKEARGQNPWIECNNDPSGKRQLYQVYFCLDKSASKIIDCPVFPHGKCNSKIEFPPF